ncbi:hypothetical protein [Parablautia intestinalis]|uniref:hypothetical protein n=1 Tax=Parablautia intestinalis TaxID=2320100 RepID=UPI0024124F0C|nr:hypothetical protein [Parablautia intestinalis]
MNNEMAKSNPSAAGFFYRRIGGTLFKVRVYTGSGYADTLDEKIPRLILNEMVTGTESYVNRHKSESCPMARIFTIWQCRIRKIHRSRISKRVLQSHQTMN